MANQKSKKNKKSAMTVSRGFGKKNLQAELSRAEARIREERWHDAYRILSELAEQYPNERKVWVYLTEVCLELTDMQSYQKAQEKWLAIEPDNGDLLYGLGFVYMMNRHPLLALQTFRCALDCEPEHERAGEAKDQISLLEKYEQEAKDNFETGTEDWMELALLHERGQAHLEAGEYEKAREAECEVIARQPGFKAARNNLSLICWVEGDVEGAIATAKSMLETAPNNIHALSNVVRFLAQTGEDEAARPYAERLKAADEPTAWNGWTKKVEGLSYLGDDTGVIEVYEQWQATEPDDEGNPEAVDSMFNHLVGVALARCGRTQDAIARWKIASADISNAAIAQKNLKNIQLPVGQRHGAWPFDFAGWLPPKTSETLYQLIASLQQTRQAHKLAKALQQFLDQHPYFVRQIPRILARGGPEGQSFVVMLAEQIEHPALIAAVKEFALSQNGTDQLRNQAAMHAVKAGLLEKSNIRLWLDGAWRNITLMAYEITDEPDTGDHSPEVSRLLEAATELLYKQFKAAALEAEGLLKEAIALEPNAPDILFNLAAAYRMQGRELESEVLVRDIHKRFPDYFFARTAVALFHIKNHDFKAAEALLAPLRTQDKFHFSEFETFMEAQIELEMARKNHPGAQAFVDIWAGAAPDHPRVAYWRGQLARSGMSKILR